MGCTHGPYKNRFFVKIHMAADTRAALRAAALIARAAEGIMVKDFIVL